MTNFPSFTDHIIALLFGLVIPVVSGFRSAKAFKTLRLNEPQRKRFFISNSYFLWMVALIIIINWLLRGRSFDVLGITQSPDLNGFVLTLTASFILLYIADTMLTLRNESEIEKARERWKETAPFMPIHYRELGAYIFMCITAGVCEEIVFRGFLVPYTETFFIDNPYSETFAVAIPALIFAAAHYYQGAHAVLKIAVLSVLFGFIFLYSGSLWIVIILHFGIDLAGGLLSIRYLKSTETYESEEADDDESSEDGQETIFEEKSEDDIGEKKLPGKDE